MRHIKLNFSSIFFSSSLAIFVYVFYKAEIIYSGENNSYYYYYYIISSLLLVLSIIYIFLNKKFKLFFLISFCSIVFSLYLFESYLIFWEKKKKIQVYENSQRIFDKRSRFEIFNDLKKKNENITSRVTPSTYLNKKEKINLFPLSGISNSETILCNENGYYAISLSDRYGFNNPNKEWDNDQIDYLLIGDSFVHGSCVNRPDDIASVLRKLTKNAVINLGYAANGPLIEYATLREYSKKNVKNIIWFYYEFNDLMDLEIELKNNILKKYIQDSNFSQNLINNQNQIDEIVKNEINIYAEKEENKKKKFELLNFIKLFRTREIFLRNQPEPQNEFIEILRSANELSKSNKSKLTFVYIPGYYKYKIGYGDKNYFKIKEIVETLGINFIDIDKEVLSKEKNPLDLFPFNSFGHFTPEGYKKIAETIYKITK